LAWALSLGAKKDGGFHANLGGGLRFVQEDENPPGAASPVFGKHLRFFGAGTAGDLEIRSRLASVDPLMASIRMNYDEAFARDLLLEHSKSLATEWFGACDLF
jgi:hypothetical protein